MQMIENPNGIPMQQCQKEHTRIRNTSGRSGTKQILDRGFGRIANTDFEPLHHQDV